MQTIAHGIRATGGQGARLFERRGAGFAQAVLNVLKKPGDSLLRLRIWPQRMHDGADDQADSEDDEQAGAGIAARALFRRSLVVGFGVGKIVHRWVGVNNTSRDTIELRA